MHGRDYFIILEFTSIFFLFLVVNSNEDEDYKQAVACVKYHQSIIRFVNFYLLWEYLIAKSQLVMIKLLHVACHYFRKKYTYLESVSYGYTSRKNFRVKIVKLR